MMIKEHHFLLHWAHRRRPSGVHLRHLWHLERNDTRFWWSGFDHVYDVCSVGVLSKLQQSSFCWPPLDLNCIVMARNRWLHIRSSMASSPERVGVFSYTSLLPILKHIDSGLSLMITALSSLATKEEEMGWVFFPFPLFSFLFSIYECHGVDYLILFMSAPEWVWFWLEAAFLPFSRSFYKMLCLEQDSIGLHQVFSQG